MAAGETGAAAINIPWQVVRDLIIGGVLAGGLWLLWKQNRFLQGRVEALLQGQQAYQAAAEALKTLTDRLLIVFAELSPEKLVKWVKATEEIYQKGAEARVREVQRELAKQLSRIRAEAESKEQETQKLVERLGRYSEAVVSLAFALYELPAPRRETHLGLVENEELRSYLKKQIADIQKQLGPSPADLSSAFGAFAGVVEQRLSAGPPPAPRAGLLGPGVLPATDVTPRTATEPKGETRTG